MERYRVNILGMRKVRWKEQWDFSSGDFQMMYLGGKETQHSVALLPDKQTNQAVMQVDCCNDRLMPVRLQVILVDEVVIVVCMHTSDHESEEVEVLYGKFEEKLKKCKGKDYRVVLGDMNATVGDEKILNVVRYYVWGRKESKERRWLTFVKEIVFERCHRNF